MSDAWQKQVGHRLRVTAAEFGMPYAKDLAAFTGAERGAVDAWFNGRALPPVRKMLILKREYGITLDWLYAEDHSGLPLATSIRLRAAMEGMAVPAVAPEPEAEPAAKVPAVRRKRSQGSAGSVRQVRKKPATS